MQSPPDWLQLPVSAGPPQGWARFQGRGRHGLGGVVSGGPAAL